MGRYSPTVVPEYGPGFTQQLADAFRTYVDTKRQRKTDEFNDLNQKVEMNRAGVREGSATDAMFDDAATGTQGAMRSIDRMAIPSAAPLPDVDFSRYLREGEPAAPPAAAASARPMGNEFSDGLRSAPANGAHMLPPSVATAQGSDPLASTRPALTRSADNGRASQFGAALQAARSSYDAIGGAPDAATTSTPSDGRDHAAVHPGAFDPTTRTFGGSPAQQAALAAGNPSGGVLGTAPSAGRTTTMPSPTSSGRYVQLDKDHYLDNAATPEARAAATKQQDFDFQRRLAQELREGDPLYQEQVRKTRADEATKADGLKKNQRAFNALAQLDPNHPLVKAGAFDESTDYLGALKEAQQEQKSRSQTKTKAEGDFNALRAEFPKSALAAQPFNENTDYTAALAAERARESQGAASERQGRAIAAGLAKQNQAFETFVDAAGNEHYMTKEEGAKQGWVPRKGGASGGVPALALVNLTRANSAIGTLNKVHAEQLKPFEDKVASGQIKFTGWDDFQRQYAAATDEHGVLNRAAFSAALANLNKANPELARYVKAAGTWALEESMLAGRPSDYRTKLDEMVSTIGPEAEPDLIKAVQDTRQTRLDGYNAARPQIQSQLGKGLKTFAGSGATGAGAAGKGAGAKIPPPQSQDEYDHLIGAGMTDAQIVQRYGQPAAAIKRKRG